MQQSRLPPSARNWKSIIKPYGGNTAQIGAEDELEEIRCDDTHMKPGEQKQAIATSSTMAETIAMEIGMRRDAYLRNDIPPLPIEKYLTMLGPKANAKARPKGKMQTQKQWGQSVRQLQSLAREFTTLHS